MKIMIVDDEYHSLSDTNDSLRKILPDAEISTFSMASKAAAEIEDGYVPDIAFLDIQMPYMNGINLAKLIKSKCPYSNIIFMTAYSEYAVDAFNVRASGYLLKPVTCEQLEAEIADLRNPIEEDKSKLLHVQCFGNFEVFSEGKPVTFAYRKTKELFAYLIDRRGASCTIEELCSILWEDKPYTEEVRNYLRKLISDLVHSLKSVHAENVFIKRRNCFSVDVSTIDCDYCRMLKGDAKAVNTYRGEYMSQYDWAIFTLGSLDRELEK